MVERRPKPHRRLTVFNWIALITTGLLILLLVTYLSLCFGTNGFEFTTFYHLLTFKKISPLQFSILMNIRGPRILAAILVGWCLGTAGAIYQGMLQNPLAEPYLLGISGGAALGAAVAGLYDWQGPVFAGTPLTAIGAFSGALLATVLLYYLSRIRGRLPVLSLILAGVVLNSIASAFILYITVTHEFFDVQRIALWMIGQIQPVAWYVLGLASAWVVAWTLLTLKDAPLFNLMALGDEVMTTWGVSVDQLRTRWLIYGAFLSGTAVFLAGMVGFIGLIIPHAVRFIFGHDYRKVLPMVAIGGAIIMVIGDTIARTVWAPIEMPVGVLTAALAGPYFLWLLRRTLTRHLNL